MPSLTQNNVAYCGALKVLFLLDFLSVTFPTLEEGANTIKFV